MNRKINIDRPEIGPEEIAKGKDFDSLLKQHAGAAAPLNKPFYKTGWFVTGASVLAVCAIVFAVWMTPANDTDSTNNAAGELAATDNLQPGDVGNVDYHTGMPFDQARVSPTHYQVNPSVGLETTYSPTGSRIIIPKNAFVDEQGTVVQDPVDIQYNEFTNATEIFAAGIPMTYKENEETYHFESAGMLEIRAFVNGKEVFANPEKQIIVEMIAQNQETDFGMYFLNETTNQWTYLGEDNLKYNDELLADANQSVQNNVPTDLHAFEEATLAINQAEIKFNEAEQALQLCIANKPNEPKEMDPTKERFVPKFNVSDFPELASYDNLMFEIGSENESGILEPYHGKVISNMNVSAGTKRGTYDVQIVYGTDVIDVLACTPVYEGDEYYQAMDRYTYEAEEYAIKKMELEAGRDLAKEELEEAYATLQPNNPGNNTVTTTTEQANAMAWHNAHTATIAQVTRIFTVQEFGIYNCDSPESYPTKAMVSATFTDMNGMNLNAQKVWLAEKDRVVMFTYDYAHFDQFGFDPEAGNVLWTVTEDGKLAVFSDFNSVPGKGSHTFEMSIHDIGSFEDLEELLDI